MFRPGDKVLVVRPECTVRHSRKGDLPSAGSWITSKPKIVETKAVIGQLGRLFIPVLLPGGDKRSKLYPDLTFLKNGVVTWKEKLRDHIKMVDHKETVIVGKVKTIRGKPILDGVHIPVILEGQTETTQIPYEQLRFREAK